MPLRPVPLSINISKYPFHSHAEISPGTQRQQQSPRAPCLTDGQTPGPLSLSVPHCSIYTSIGGASETPSLTAWAVLGPAIFPSDSLPASYCISCPLRVPRGVRTPLSFHRPTASRRICNPLPMPHRLRRPPQMSHPRRLVPSCPAAVATPRLPHALPQRSAHPVSPQTSVTPPKPRDPPRPPTTGPGRPSPASSPPAGGAAYSSRKAASRRYGNRFPRPPAPPPEAASQSAPTSRVGERGGPGRQNGRRFRST
ncbi:PREDICTED: uncharacterized protein LOC104841502 [Haliaeetus leucocephalus]|uniref:uncharacterized protein LOC104841502 n=1 Tax=Haliaeetus leucocephalus TaxID=52644 RepID=UPI00053CED4B|nr:PREDICTED: uncharacterized protein LOC104841502 [Haliaeetus leucocephalus]